MKEIVQISQKPSVGAFTFQKQIIIHQIKYVNIESLLSLMNMIVRIGQEINVSDHIGSKVTSFLTLIISKSMLHVCKQNKYRDLAQQGGTSILVITDNKITRPSS
jgi:phosphotransferase system HPr-like phosphotransfer protein